mmetsp:Transcript_44656/g.142187  ORF Transcript_44656/g.142187 Transcript_44656/m.142187 type:complete len:84 (+) Transcript_44656:1742-1993(+)
MRQHAGLADVDIQSEVDRYMVMPGQALSYKVGETKILELKAFAEEKLGAKFSLPKFHTVLLNQGGLPLNILERNVHEWVAASV